MCANVMSTIHRKIQITVYMETYFNPDQGLNLQLTEMTRNSAGQRVRSLRCKFSIFSSEHVGR